MARFQSRTVEVGIVTNDSKHCSNRCPFFPLTIVPAFCGLFDEELKSDPRCSSDNCRFNRTLECRVRERSAK